MMPEHLGWVQKCVDLNIKELRIKALLLPRNVSTCGVSVELKMSCHYHKRPTTDTKTSSKASRRPTKVKKFTKRIKAIAK